MRKGMSKVGAVLVSGVALAAVTGVAHAEPAAGHQVRYTLTSAAPYDFQVLYLTAQPADKAAYNADAYSYVKRETINVGPGAPWVFETTLADPQWAILQVSSTTKGGVGAPNPHCDVAVDGQVIVAQDAPYSLVCQGSQW
ncbi:MAG: hypothetical protein HYZ39_21125 [Mycolicibacterium cosmeticum]|nr:hypothetical protein [Mycolicibacterium cosmeticum]